MDTFKWQDFATENTLTKVMKQLYEDEVLPHIVLMSVVQIAQAECKIESGIAMLCYKAKQKMPILAWWTIKYYHWKAIEMRQYRIRFRKYCQFRL